MTRFIKIYKKKRYTVRLPPKTVTIKQFTFMPFHLKCLIVKYRCLCNLTFNTVGLRALDPKDICEGKCCICATGGKGEKTSQKHVIG